MTKQELNFSETYLYKIHALSSLLDTAFDRTLRKHANITLSQCMILLAVAQHTRINQRQVAAYLGISPAAVKRQVDVAKRRDWLEITAQDIRGEGLRVTAEGRKMITAALHALEQHAFKIFDDHNRSANLMQHLDLLLRNTREAINDQATARPS